ncbi:MAG TPA: YggS family pyridoxal phosphate-dependent enzyme [Longimicrobiales bacterium]
MEAGKLREKLLRVEEQIEAARRRAGRSDAVGIIAVTKTHPVSTVEAALSLGLDRIGENRVQELEAKVEAIGRDRAEWHLIGHLQRNKVRRALPLFDVIHSIDSLRLARELSAEAERAGVDVVGLVQVNTSGEASKYGFGAAEAVDAVAEVVSLPRLRVRGLMTMAPYTSEEATLRRTFAGARRLFERCAEEVPGFEPVHLSMGMSNDFEIAVEEGSTLVRLGTVLFGERGT